MIRPMGSNSQYWKPGTAVGFSGAAIQRQADPQVYFSGRGHHKTKPAENVQNRILPLPAYELLPGERQYLSAFLRRMQQIMKPYGLAYILDKEHHHQSPVEIVRDLTREGIMVYPVPLLDRQVGAPLLSDPAFLKAIGPENAQRLQAYYAGPDLSPMSRTMLGNLDQGGRITATNLATIDLTRKTSLGVGTFLGVTHGLAGKSLDKIGTPAQKALFLNALNQGVLTYAFGLTEAEAGSNPAGMITTYQKFEKDGQTYYRLNGNKKFIGNAARVTDAAGNVTHRGADFIVVYAVDNPQAPPKMRHYKAFMVPRSLIGEENIRRTGGQYSKQGMDEVNNGDFDLINVEVPASLLLGGPEAPGESERNDYGKLISILTESRLYVAAMALGATEAVLEKARAYATGNALHLEDSTLKREAGRLVNGRLIARFPGVSNPLNKLSAQALATRLLVLDTARRLDDWYRQGARKEQAEGLDLLTAMAKYYASELSKDAAEKAQMTLGGRGFIEEYGIAHIRRAQDVAAIYEGTSDINRNIIAGAILMRANKAGVLQKLEMGLHQYKLGKLSPGAWSKDPLKAIDWIYQEALANAIPHFQKEFRQVRRNWDVTKTQGWDDKSILREQLMEAANQSQAHLYPMVDIAVEREMAKLAQRRIHQITRAMGKRLTPEAKQEVALLNLFLRLALENAESHLNSLRKGRSVEYLDSLSG